MKHFYITLFSKKLALGLVALVFSLGNTTAQTTATFEDLLLAENSYWTNTEAKNGFSNGDAYFYSHYDTKYNYLSGFTYSNSTDVTTVDYTNQHSAISGSGYKNSTNYAVALGGASVKLSSPRTVNGFYITNTTYTYFTIKNGSTMSKIYGGVTGTDPDYFILTTYGYLNGQIKTDSVNFYLADYRFEDSNEDYIVDSWTWLDLTKLGEIDSLSFEYTSTDNNQWGNLTPANFAMDNFEDQTITSNKASRNFSWNVYPNPAQDFLHLSLPENISEGSIKICDVNGQTLINKPILQGQENPVSVKELKTGAYIISVNSESYTATKTFLKQ